MDQISEPVATDAYPDAWFREGEATPRPARYPGFDDTSTAILVRPVDVMAAERRRARRSGTAPTGPAAGPATFGARPDDTITNLLVGPPIEPPSVEPVDRATNGRGKHAPRKAAPFRLGTKRRRRRSLPAHDPATMRITALVPAHNEEDQIGDTIDSLLAQKRPPERIIVIADNCSDSTVEIARGRGVDVFETVGNQHKKAGGLNQVLDRLLPVLGPRDAVLVMDADSTLGPEFLSHGLERLATGEFGGVGGTFTGKPGGGFVGMLQRNEYARYVRDVQRLQGKALVLTGTATLFRALALQEVVEARRTRVLPGLPQVYDTRVLTEDNELTLAILHLGLRIICPPKCTLETEVMLTWRDLFNQRLRWKRGALENLTDYGWTRVTRSYWGRQVLSLIGLLVIVIYLSSLLFSLIVTGSVVVQPVWMAVTLVFALERAVTVRSRGPVQMVLGALIVVEMAFDLFLQAAQAKAFWDAIRNKERKW
ncbi:glycosyltransferase [Yinghuangia seranimata]|uniref:glycosyltransferase n=1 Tax=Yinghuangia seranimata TaxID=408067 RepID=UPI00248C9EF8|nr:glycosyltransferase family 2 protein [Yinghuangia seranimata]MDI2126773.1 glycosyltransferase family 2 protein [Yinghuangia seranimata]